MKRNRKKRKVRKQLEGMKQNNDIREIVLTTQKCLYPEDYQIELWLH